MVFRILRGSNLWHADKTNIFKFNLNIKGSLIRDDVLKSAKKMIVSNYPEIECHCCTAQQWISWNSSSKIESSLWSERSRCTICFQSRHQNPLNNDIENEWNLIGKTIVMGEHHSSKFGDRNCWTYDHAIAIFRHVQWCISRNFHRFFSWPTRAVSKFLLQHFSGP